MIVPYVEDTNSDILFTIKVIEMNFCRYVHGVRLYLPTRFEPGIARNTEVIADRTIRDKRTDGNYSLFPIMWTSNRRHVYLVCVIRLHPNGVFSNGLMQNQRHENRKTSGWSKSACSVNGRYRQRYLRVRVFNNFVNNVDIEPWSRILCSRHPITSEWRVFECVDDKEATR